MDQKGQVNFYQKYNVFFIVLGIFLLALTFRILLFQYRFAIGFDEPHFLQLAISARLGGLKAILHPFWPPGYPLFIVLFSYIIQDVELAGRLVSVVLGSATIFPIFYLTRLLFDRKIAVIATLLIALNPMLAFFNTSILVESTYMMLAISGIAMSWKAIQKKSLLGGLITGFFWSLSYLTRPDGIGFLIIFTTIIVGKILFDKTDKQRMKLITVWLVLILSFVVTALPYLVYLRQQIGKWSLSLKWEVGKLDISELNSLSSDNRWLPLDMAYHYGNYVKIYEIYDFKDQVNVNHYLVVKEKTKNFYKVLNQNIPKLMSSLLFILFIFGIFKAEYASQRLWLTFYLLIIIAFFWFLIVPLFYVNDRYLLPILPLGYVWISKGVNVFWSWLSRSIGQFHYFKGKLRTAKIMATISVLIFILVFSYLPELGKVVTLDKYSKEFYADAIELKNAGVWLKKYSQNSPRIMSYNKAVDFYAGVYNIRQGAAIPQNTIDRLLAYAKYHDVEYLVLTERYKGLFPHIAFLLEQEKFPEKLALIYEEKGESGFLTRIFQLLN